MGVSCVVLEGEGGRRTLLPLLCAEDLAVAKDKVEFLAEEGAVRGE